jgi:hypothetical protein
MDEERIKLEARLYALERSVCILLAAIYRLTGAEGPALLEHSRQQTTEGARALTFPEFDPAMSDLFAAEVEAATDRLLAMQRELLGTAR